MLVAWSMRTKPKTDLDDENLPSKAVEASKRIDALQQKTGRG